MYSVDLYRHETMRASARVLGNDKLNVEKLL